ncbi:DUF4149 domain-containing protein [Pseudaestuariivita atlantica]|uniref:3-demethylubiquinone-9 3-methyltransferase n=1 Tax=Pseudaestuariivita atlantica TaxID=1317121 RepID=A0A0L1JMC6_9RHOB|nr:DUF4149 domain-containing protein [Pseudaestuariivita atlantica]KNG92872.1 3-demethylubiquinone-9 3-methyltransferase [Pseudaestuariivita atlantica]
MQVVALLLTAALFGGMVFFSFGFAPVLFKLLGLEQTRPILRGTFPYYYLVVIGVAGAAALTAMSASLLGAALLGAICGSTIYARQVLMPRINAATDAGDTAGFKRLHGASVVLQLVQIAACAYALVLIT